MKKSASTSIKRKTIVPKLTQDTSESKDQNDNPGLRTLERVLAQHEEQKSQLSQLKKKAAAGASNNDAGNSSPFR